MFLAPHWPSPSVRDSRFFAGSGAPHAIVTHRNAFPPSTVSSPSKGATVNNVFNASAAAIGSGGAFTYFNGLHQ